MDVREELTWFAGELEEVLRQNDYKGGWSECRLSYLVRRLKEEVVELEDALVDREDVSAITHECCDVALFAMMIADKLRPERSCKPANDFKKLCKSLKTENTEDEGCY